MQQGPKDSKLPNKSNEGRPLLRRAPSKKTSQALIFEESIKNKTFIERLNSSQSEINAFPFTERQIDENEEIPSRQSVQGYVIKPKNKNKSNVTVYDSPDNRELNILHKLLEKRNPAVQLTIKKPSGCPFDAVKHELELQRKKVEQERKLEMAEKEKLAKLAEDTNAKEKNPIEVLITRETTKDSSQNSFDKKMAQVLYYWTSSDRQSLRIADPKDSIDGAKPMDESDNDLSRPRFGSSE